MADAEAPAAAPPMQALSEVEKLENEKKRLEEELRYVQLQMTDTLNLNDGLLAELRQKDETLVKREEYFAIVSEKNATELAQLEVETECAEQMSTYDIETLQGQVNLLQLQKERYNTLTQENEDLESTFVSMLEEVSQTSMNHSLGIHEMNKDMLTVRENLEGKLRHELTAMDNRYQQHAFSSLNEADKRDIFDNAKLKDEVTLQSIGIANLTLRLDKQKHGTETCKKEIRRLNKQTNYLRDQLGDLAMTKIHRNKTISDLDEEIQSLKHKREDLNHLLHKGSELSELTDMIEECKEKTKAERLAADLWQNRLEAIFSMQDDMIPTNPYEVDGKFSSTTHKLFSTSASLTAGDTTNTNWEDISTQGGARLADINEAMAQDPALRKALKTFVGKESAIVGGKGEVENQNMAAWVICEVIKAWMKSKADLQGQYEILEKERQKRQKMKQPLVEVTKEELPAVEEIGQQPNQDEKDDMWDEVFMTDSHNMDSAASSWYGLRDNAKRIPDGIKVGMPSLNERFHFDAIRPANISYDLDPPVSKFSVSQNPISNLSTMRKSQQKETLKGLGSASTTCLPDAPRTAGGKHRKKDVLKSAIHHSIKPASGILMMTKAHSVSNLQKPKHILKSDKGAASTNKL